MAYFNVQRYTYTFCITNVCLYVVKYRKKKKKIEFNTVQICHKKCAIGYFVVCFGLLSVYQLVKSTLFGVWDCDILRHRSLMCLLVVGVLGRFTSFTRYHRLR